MSKFRPILNIVLIFLAGVVVGAGIATVVISKRVKDMVKRGPDALVDAVASRLDRELKLDAPQKDQLQKIVLETRTQLNRVRRESQPRVDIVLAKAQSEVRAILRPDQLPKFDKIINRGRARLDPTPSPATPAPAPQ